MRIISGSAGGLTLQVPRSVTRPTSDRVREALFSILGDRVRGARVLDLFAGSGALGLEALSRGAVAATFVEQDRRAVDVIRRNLAHCRLDPPPGNRAGFIRLHATDVYQWLRRFGSNTTATSDPAMFDLVFADPPYTKRDHDRDHARDLLAHPRLPGLLTTDGWLVLETTADWRPPDPPPPPWQQQDDRCYGGTRLSCWRAAPTGAP